MKKNIVLLLSSILFSLTCKAQIFEMDTILYNGPTDKYINFVILGDGYDSNELDLYHNDVITLRDGFFNKPPFSNYKNYFNIIAIKVISPESGIKHPRTANDCPSLAKLPISNPNNYFGTTFDNSKIHRLIYPTDYAGIGWVLANNFPDYDQIIILGNSPEYGGAGGQYATFSTHNLSVEIMLHECGHSFAGLADEYWAGNNYASEKRNMTHETNATPELVKWRKWLDTLGVGIYPYDGDGNAANWFKPHTNCEMEFLQREFCAVCSQVIVEKIQTLTNPIEEYEPAELVLNEIDMGLVFKINKLMLPIPNTLKTEWQLDGKTFAKDTLTISVPADSISDKYHTITAVVIDTTTLVRASEIYTNNIYKVIWHINKDRVVSIQPEIIKTRYNLYPNPASNYIYIKSEDLIANEVKQISLTDLNGKNVFSQKFQPSNNYFEYSIPVDNYATGIYILNVHTTNGIDRIKVSISRE